MRKVEKPFYNTVVFWIFVGVIVFAISAAFQEDEKSDNASRDSIASESLIYQRESLSISVEPQTRSSEKDVIPIEFKSAVMKAEFYANDVHMSKLGVYNQLISEYGEKFSEEAATYAIEHITVDWKENALKKAEDYLSNMHFSQEGVYDQLVSEHGERFTEEEARYAADNVKADWKDNALKTANSYQSMMSMSPEAIRDQLVSEYGSKFTQEQADYAIENLDK